MSPSSVPAEVSGIRPDKGWDTDHRQKQRSQNQRLNIMTVFMQEDIVIDAGTMGIFPDEDKKA